MVTTIKTHFFDIFGAINTFSHHSFAWSPYKDYAIPRIINFTKVIQQAEKQRKSLTIEQLQEELQFVEDYLFQLSETEELLQHTQENNIKHIALDFIAAVRSYQSALEDELENKVFFYNARLNQAPIIAKYLEEQ